MRLVVIDFETLFGDDIPPPPGHPHLDNKYTLSVMTTESYCRDPRFEAHGAAIKWGKDFAAKWYDERQLRQVLKEEDWSDVCIICHHAHFDGLILTHLYGVVPAMWGCTLSMARLLLGNHISVSLDSVRGQFGLPAKRTPYHLFRGKHWSDLDTSTRNLIAEGACDEVESIWKIFGLLAKEFPAEEYLVVDRTIKMFTEPVLQADVELLAKIWEKEAREKQARLEALQIDVSSLQSAEQFAALLRAEGIEPATKPGKPNPDGSEKLIYAFAKSDPFMEELLDHDDDRVRALAEARLGAKSTLLQTRAETLGWMASRGSLCVYLRMYGAHTTRWSGGDSSNFQNLKKDDPEYPMFESGESLRDAIEAPPGHILLKPDASQIECRLLNYVSGQDDVIERFRNGEDPYVNVASQFYGYPVNKKDHPNERQLGKILELQAGYGSGGPKIVQSVRVKSGGKILLTPDEGMKARDAYRDTHPCNQDFWKQSGRLLSRLAGGDPVDWPLGCGRLALHVREGRIYLPNGAPMIYHLDYYKDPESGDSWWRRRTRKGYAKIYGAALVENIIQGLARVVISQAFIRLANMGYRIVGMEHDSLWIVIPENDGHKEQHLRNIHDEFVREPQWLPGIPLGCEIN